MNPSGEPVYGQRDTVNLAELRELGVPFWLAGGYGSPEKMREAVGEGAAGMQVGTAFAFSDESGLRPDLKRELVMQAAGGSARVFTDPLASPTGFPFKVAQIVGSVSERQVYEGRMWLCDLGFLREAYAKADGSLGYRCSAEPQACYAAKGGKIEETAGRKCLCNALLANIGLAQVRKGGTNEPPLVTVGDDLNVVRRLIRADRMGYSAEDVVESLLSVEEVA